MLYLPLLRLERHDLGLERGVFLPERSELFRMVVKRPFQLHPRASLGLDKILRGRRGFVCLRLHHRVQFVGSVRCLLANIGEGRFAMLFEGNEVTLETLQCRDDFLVDDGRELEGQTSRIEYCVVVLEHVVVLRVDGREGLCGLPAQLFDISCVDFAIELSAEIVLLLLDLWGHERDDLCG
ncbi:hypothetical protein EXIGLDRAFT_180304 [Exidia glandulosa HHB12029]|uniref:Uncharacterized protein n=1 Tax=Exidia glandulosa HHB12029 TaxID=1314781 RepID=A0A165F3J3_EXIGL|nr:hypothetical protein EXIGLDRAFT_180304 [Exidia glandulosa HHB12029]